MIKKQENAMIYPENISKASLDYFSKIKKEVAEIKVEIKIFKATVTDKSILQRVFNLEKRIFVIEKKLAKA